MSTPEILPPTQSPNDAETPIFPAWVLLAVSGVAFFAAVFFLMIHRTAGVEVFGALGVTIISLVTWALMNPDQLKDVLRGRVLMYGGTAVIATVVFLTVLVFVYIIVRQQGWKRDFSEQKILTLTDQARSVIQTISADPTMPALKIIGFFGVSNGSARDLSSILLDEIADASNGKITYGFIDPDQDPLTVESYNAQTGQFIVGPVGADGNLSPENFETFAGIDQQSVVDALITASSTGKFNAYFLRVQDGVDFTTAEAGGGLLMSEDLSTRYKWTAKAVTMLDLMSTKPTVTLNDPNVDGDVMVIAGGAQPLAADQVKIITDYLDKGGNLVIFGGFSTSDQTPLASGDPLSSYLYDNFGVKVDNDLVIDLDNAVRNVFSFQALASDIDHFIVRDFKDTGFLFFIGSHSLSLNPQTPADVTVNVLSSTSAAAYSKTGLDLTRELTEDDIVQTQSDKSGALPLVVASENSRTGSRVVVFGGVSSVTNDMRQYDGSGVSNTDMARNAIVWAAGYDTFRNIPSLDIVVPQPIPLIANDAQLRLVQFAAVLLLPAIILMVGGWRWWARRERERV